MMRATARIASGLSAVSTRRNSPQDTTAGPESQTSETMGGTSRSALSRLVQASRKLLRVVGGLEVGVTFQNPERRANFSTVLPWAVRRGRGQCAQVLGAQLGRQAKQRGTSKHYHGNGAKRLREGGNGISGKQTDQCEGNQRCNHDSFQIPHP